MTEPEKQERLSSSKKIIEILTPMFQAQAAQAKVFSRYLIGSTFDNRPADIFSHKAGFDTALYASILQEGVRKAERLLEAHSKVVALLQNTEATSLEVVDVVKILESGRLLDGQE